MYLRSHNILSLRAHDIQTLLNTAENTRIDVLCLQEHRLPPNAHRMTEGYDAYYAAGGRAGYSGVVTFVNKKCCWPVVGGTNKADLVGIKDEEGRVVITDHGAFLLINVYCPAESGPERNQYKLAFHEALTHLIEKYHAQGRAVILAGDLNVAHREIDHCDPIKSCAERGITQYSDTPFRRWITALLETHMQDTFRIYHPERIGAFTCWSTLIDAKAGNYGTRIDYVLCSKSLLELVSSADIKQKECHGSDHCPVDIVIRPPPEPIPYQTPPGFCENVISTKQMQLKSFFIRPSESSSGSILSQPTPLANRGGSDKFQNTKSVKPGKASKSDLRSYFVRTRDDSIDANPKAAKRSTPNEGSITTSQEITPSPAYTLCSPVSQEAIEPITPDSIESAQFYDRKIDDHVKRSEQWSHLFRPVKRPLCAGHQEECKEFTVHKKGANQGRMFFLCARPVGPKESKANSEWRCNTFIWKSELS